MKYSRILKILLSSAAAVYVFWAVDFSILLSTFELLQWPWLLLFVTIGIISRLLMGMRWGIIVKIWNESANYKLIIKTTLESTVFNSILPGTIGGDGYKTVALISQGLLERDKAVWSVLVDRIIGLTGIYLCFLIGLFNGLILGFPALKTTALILVAIPVGGLALFLILLRTKTRILKRPIAFLKTKLNIVGNFQFSSLFTFVVNHRNKLLLSLALSILTFFVAYLAIPYFGFQALREPQSYATMMAVVPMVNLILLLPISIGGLGVRETLFITMFGFFGASEEASLAVGLIALGIRLFYTLIGFLLTLIR